MVGEDRFRLSTTMRPPIVEHLVRGRFQNGLSDQVAVHSLPLSLPSALWSSLFRFGRHPATSIRDQAPSILNPVLSIQNQVFLVFAVSTLGTSSGIQDRWRRQGETHKIMGIPKVAMELGSPTAPRGLDSCLAMPTCYIIYATMPSGQEHRCTDRSIQNGGIKRPRSHP